MASAAWALIVGVVVFGMMASSVDAMGHHRPPHGGTQGNWSHSCPSNDSTTNLCSVMVKYNWTFTAFLCCNHIRDGGDDDLDSSEVSDDLCGGICPVNRTVTFQACITDCCPGYLRDKDGRCQNKTDEIYCLNGGTKVPNSDGTHRCECRPGYLGRTCDKYDCHCRNEGMCVLKGGEPACECRDGYYGRYCEMHKCGMPCYNGGKCFNNGTMQFCNCTAGYMGKYCESKFEQSDRCPPIAPYHPGEECVNYCYNDDHCHGEYLCCQDGCSRVCKRPSRGTCYRDGRHFAVGDEYSPNDCEKCTCTESGELRCYIIDCAMPLCKEGYSPVTKPGMCCPVCAEDRPTKPPTIGCPRFPVTIDLPERQSSVWLTSENTDVRAFDSSGRDLNVEFQPRYVKHCKCSWGRRFNYTVRALARDSTGTTASCKLDVYVRDPHPPVFKSCPEDVFVMFGEPAHWQEPAFYDNIGNDGGMRCSWRRNGKTGAQPCSQINGAILTIANYTFQYYVSDYDGNRAICKFDVVVLHEDTPFDKLPQGLRERTKEEEPFNVGVVVGPIVGAIGIFALMIALCLWCRMKRAPAPRASHQVYAPPRQTYDNNIYHLPTDVKLKPPPYSLPVNPPPYSNNADLKEGEYAEISPPAYSETDLKSESYVNPEYVTMGTKSDV